MKIHLEIDTSEELSPQSLQSLVNDVVSADLLCRQRYGPAQWGDGTRGDWTYSREENLAIVYTLHYAMKVTKE